jgi:CelD/BcsL family acetyltransferase involved in cellulose biosynthesis
MNPQSCDSIQIVAEPLTDIAQLGTEWRELDRQGNHSFFVSWDWIGPWLHSLPRTDKRQVLRAMRGQKTIGLAIVTYTQAYFRRLVPTRQAWLNSTGDNAFDCITVEHNGLAASLQEGEELWTALVQWFSASAGLDEFVLPGLKNLPSVKSESQLIIAGGKEVGFRIDLKEKAIGGDFRLRLTRNSRQQLNRAIRRLECIGPIDVDVAHDLTTSLRYFEGMKELHTRSWNRRGKGGAFDAIYFEKFCRELIAAGQKTDAVEMMRIMAGNFIVGYLLNLKRRDVVYNYQSGFNDSDSKLRPGYVCHAFAIDHYSANSVRYYDFLAKPNQLKQSFGSQTYDLLWLHLRKPKCIFRAERFVRRMFGRDPIAATFVE